MENDVRCVYEGAKANGSTMNGWNNEYFRAECEQASIELDRRNIRILSNVALDHPKIEEAPLIDTQKNWGNTYLTEIFCNSLRGGPDVPNTLKDHVRCSTMIFAAIESGRTGKSVDVRAYLRKHLDAREQGEE
jgi:hypothetical protein